MEFKDRSTLAQAVSLDVRLYMVTVLPKVLNAPRWSAVTAVPVLVDARSYQSL